MTDTAGSRPRELIVRDSSRRPSLRLVELPGPLVSVSAQPPPPGSVTAPHPFLTATFLCADNEGELGALLRGSDDFDTFLRSVMSAGYTVHQVDSHAGIFTGGSGGAE